MEEMHYIGCFFAPEDVEAAMLTQPRQRLSRTILHPHVTFVYRPDTVPEALFGLPVTVKAVGYGNDGENEGLLVEFSDLPEDLAPLAARIPVPHITLSVSETGKPVNSRYLSFRSIDPFFLTGVFGGMDEAGAVRTFSGSHI